MARATAVFLLAVVAFPFVSAALDPLSAVQPAGATSDQRYPPVHCCKQEEEAVAMRDQTAGDVADLASAEEQGQRAEAHRSKKRNSDDDDDDDGHDDADTDDNEKDHDDDVHDHHDDDDDDDDNGGSNTDHDFDSDSVHDSHSDHDPNNHHDDNSKGGKKKRSAPGRERGQGGNR